MEWVGEWVNFRSLPKSHCKITSHHEVKNDTKHLVRPRTTNNHNNKFVPVEPLYYFHGVRWLDSVPSASLWTDGSTLESSMWHKIYPLWRHHLQTTDNQRKKFVVNDSSHWLKTEPLIYVGVKITLRIHNLRFVTTEYKTFLYLKVACHCKQIMQW